MNRDGHLDIVLVKGRHWPLRNLVLLGIVMARSDAVNILYFGSK